MELIDLLNIFNVFAEDKVITLVVKVAIILSVASYVIRSLIIPTLRDIINFKNDKDDNEKRKEMNNKNDYKVTQIQNQTLVINNHFSIKNTKD